MDVTTGEFARRVPQLRTPVLPALLTLVPPGPVRLDRPDQVRQPLARFAHLRDQPNELVFIVLVHTCRRKCLIHRGVSIQSTPARHATASDWRSFDPLRWVQDSSWRHSALARRIGPGLRGLAGRQLLELPRADLEAEQPAPVFAPVVVVVPSPELFAAVQPREQVAATRTRALPACRKDAGGTLRDRVRALQQ